MKLRPELTPPTVDESKVRLLAKIASRLDGAWPRGPGINIWDADVEAFNHELGTSFDLKDFQGVYGAVNHDKWVRGIMYQQHAARCVGVIRDEMIEIVKRIMACQDDQIFYVQLFVANCKHPSETDLIFWPDLVPEFSGDREPTVEEIVDLAMKA
jgi:hypothetical protein